MNCELKDLTIGYATYTVVENINATLKSGELTCLLGANGAGKSTLLRTISAFQPSLKGNITIDNHDIANIEPRERAKLIGVVLTERTNVQNMTVTELVGMGRAPYTGFWGALSKEDKEIVSDAIAQVGISELATRMVHTLSDGERQKTMIAKTLAQQTPVIFLDEPTAFLDYPSKVETMQLLLRLCHESGKTILLSTHDIEIALQMADNLWLMEKGKGVSIGSPKQLAQDGTIQRFLHRPDVIFHPEDMTIKIRTTSPDLPKGEEL